MVIDMFRRHNKSHARHAGR